MSGQPTLRRRRHFGTEPYSRTMVGKRGLPGSGGAGEELEEFQVEERG